jgi:hypothetical protein
MKSFAKILLISTVAVAAIALSAASSEAAKKKAAKAAACKPGASCVSKSGVRQFCGGDGKWVAILAPACSGQSCGGPKC